VSLLILFLVDFGVDILLIDCNGFRFGDLLVMRVNPSFIILGHVLWWEGGANWSDSFLLDIEFPGNIFLLFIFVVVLSTLRKSLID